MRHIYLIVSLLVSNILNAQEIETEILDFYKKSGFDKACRFSLENKLDSSLYYCNKSISKGVPIEIFFIHPDLKTLKSDSVYWTKLEQLLYTEFILTNPGIAKPDIGFKLFEIYTLDQKHRSLYHYFHTTFDQKLEKVSTEQHNLNRKKRIKEVSSIIDVYGWLGYSEIGIKPGNGLFYVIQHSYPEDELLEKYIPLLIKKALIGEASLINAAKMIDRYLFRKHGYQIYGTQTYCTFKDSLTFCSLPPILEEKKVNHRRKALNLESIEAQCKTNGFEYKPQSKHKKIPKKFLKRNFLLNIN